MIKNKTYKGLIIFLLTLILSCSSVDTFQGMYKVKHIKGFLWKAKSEKTTVYLLGSIHLAKKELYPLDDLINIAYDESDALVVEIDVTSINPFDMLQAGMYKNSKTLKTELSDSTFKKLEKLLVKHNIPEKVYRSMKPWFATMMILGLELKDAGYDEQLGIDMHFLNKAKDDKEILQLESVEQQLKIFNEDFKDIQEEFVNYSFTDQDILIEQVNQLTDYWIEGNIKAMEKLALEPIKDYPLFQPIFDKLYLERNVKMFDKIKKYLDTEKVYFVVVGSAHLIGELGIVNLLINEK